MMKKLFTFFAAALFAGSMMAGSLIKFDQVQPATEVAGSTYGDEGYGFTLEIPATSDKAIIDEKGCTFGTSEEDKISFTHRLKTGGKSNKTGRIFTLTIPEEGPLVIYARPSSEAATDRNFVIRNGSDTIVNHICLDTDTVEDASSKIFLPFIVENVPAGTYEISYPVEGINFYGFQLGYDEPTELATLTAEVINNGSAIQVTSSDEELHWLSYIQNYYAESDSATCVAAMEQEIRSANEMMGTSAWNMYSTEGNVGTQTYEIPGWAEDGDEFYFYAFGIANAGDGTLKIASNMAYIAHFVYHVTPSALENTAAGVKAVKTIENGQMVIIREGKRYNAVGAEL